MARPCPLILTATSMTTSTLMTSCNPCNTVLLLRLPPSASRKRELVFASRDIHGFSWGASATCVADAQGHMLLLAVCCGGRFAPVRVLMQFGKRCRCIGATEGKMRLWVWVCVYLWVSACYLD